MSGGVQRAYEIFLRLHEEYGGAEGDGVLLGTWKRACLEAGMPESTVRYTMRYLREKARLVTQDGPDGPYYPAARPGESDAGAEP